MLYVGVDAHKSTSHLTIVNKNGVVLKRKQVPSSLEGLRHVLAPYSEPVKAVLEASYSWGPIYDWLDELVDEVVLAHPAKVKAIADARLKSDKVDSETLAHLLRADLIPPAYAPSKEIRACKRVLRQRMFFVGIRTMTKNRVWGLLSQHAIKLPDASDLFGKNALRELDLSELPLSDQRLVQENLELIQVLNERIAATERLIKELASGDAAVEWLSSLPGIGTFFSVLIRYEVDDVRRFATAKKFVSHTGLIPSTYASAKRLTHALSPSRGTNGCGGPSRRP